MAAVVPEFQVRSRRDRICRQSRWRAGPDVRRGFVDTVRRCEQYPRNGRYIITTAKNWKPWIRGLSHRTGYATFRAGRSLRLFFQGYTSARPAFPKGCVNPHRVCDCLPAFDHLRHHRGRPGVGRRAFFHEAPPCSRYCRSSRRPVIVTATVADQRCRDR